MMSQTVRERLEIGGMTCRNCEGRIRRALQSMPGVGAVEVSHGSGWATVEYDGDILGREAILSAVEGLGYTARPARGAGRRAAGLAGTALIVMALYLVLRHTGLSGYFAAFPTAEAGMDYGMLFLIGLLTSVHCVAMCGGINLTQCIPSCAGQREGVSVLRPGLLYNLGRVLSYTLVGGIVGALGAAVTLSGLGKGVIQLAAGGFMVLMGANMLGLLPGVGRLLPRLPDGLGDRLRGGSKGRGPLIVGLLNGLMPCGPLQAMQLYALSTGSAVAGALSMLLFSLGTVPLMLGLSLFSASMSRRFTRCMMTAGAVLVAVLGVSMFQNGLALSGAGIRSGAPAPQETAAAPGDAMQVVNTHLSPYGYEAITVEAGVPVQWTITAAEGTVNGCNGRLVVPEYGVEKRLEVGDNVIEFTPSGSGVFPYSCWMGMIRSTITVTEGGGHSAEPGAQAPVSPRYNAPAGSKVTYALPDGDPAVAWVGGNVQLVSVALTSTGFSPAAVVVQAGLETQWIIDNKMDTAQTLVFPDYGLRLVMEPGENAILVEPDEDFAFWMADGSFGGYVRVVDDVVGADLEALRQELAGYVISYSPDFAG